MPYKVLVEEVSLLKKIGELVDQQGNRFDEHAAVIYYFGDVVPDSEVAPQIVRAYDEDDHHTRSILERTNDTPTVPERIPSALPQPVAEVQDAGVAESPTGAAQEAQEDDEDTTVGLPTMFPPEGSEG